MPFTANGYYNNQQLGQAMTNIASLFAPPTFQEQLAGATLQQARDTAAAKTAALGRLQTQYPGIKGLADLYTGGDSDPVVHAGKLMQLQLAADNPTNLAVQDAANYANTGTVAGTITGKAMEPISTDQVRYTPAMATGAAGPTTQYGVLKNGDRTTLLPNGMLPSLIGAPAPAATADDSTDDATPAASTITPTATTPGGAAISNAKPVGAAAPDNGVSVASNGITTIDSPDKAAKEPTIDQATAKWLAAQPPDVQNKFFADYVQGKAKGSGTNINVNTGNPQKVDDAVTAADAESVKADVTAGYAAPESLKQIGYMRAAVKQAGPNLSTGPFAQYVLKGKQAIGNMLGTEIPGASEAEVLNNIGNTLATQGARAISSRPTQFEFAQQLAVKPGIAQTPQGMDALLNIKEQDARDQMAIAQLARDPANLRNWAQTRANYFATHPIMSPFDPSKPLGQSDIDKLGGPALPPGATAAPVAIKTVDGYNALPAGSTYINPSDGSVRTKR